MTNLLMNAILFKFFIKFMFVSLGHKLHKAYLLDTRLCFVKGKWHITLMLLNRLFKCKVINRELSLWLESVMGYSKFMFWAWYMGEKATYEILFSK